MGGGECLRGDVDPGLDVRVVLTGHGPETHKKDVEDGPLVVVELHFRVRHDHIEDVVELGDHAGLHAFRVVGADERQGQVSGDVLEGHLLSPGRLVVLLDDAVEPELRLWVRQFDDGLDDVDELDDRLVGGLTLLLLEELVQLLEDRLELRVGGRVETAVGHRPGCHEKRPGPDVEHLVVEVMPLAGSVDVRPNQFGQDDPEVALRFTVEERGAQRLDDVVTAGDGCGGVRHESTPW